MTALHPCPPSTTLGQPTTQVEIAPTSAQAMLAASGTILVDVREPDEHARERISGALNVALSRLASKDIEDLCASSGAWRVIFHCKGGRRSMDAATRCEALAGRGIEIHSMAGGIEAWKARGLAVETDVSKPRMGVMQQTQAFAGIMVLTSVAAGAFLHPAFLIVTALLGVGMVHAGLTGNCSFSVLLAKLPWNRPNRISRGNCATGSCSRGEAK